MRNRERAKRALKKNRIPFWQQPNERLTLNCFKMFCFAKYGNRGIGPWIKSSFFEKVYL